MSGVLPAVLHELPVGLARVVGERLVFVNRPLAALLGSTPEALAGTPMLDVVAPEDRALVAERYRIRQEGGQVPVAYEVTLLRPDGRRVRAELQPRVVGEGDAIVLVRDRSEGLRDRELLLAMAELSARLQTLPGTGAVLAAAQDGLGRMGFTTIVMRVDGDHLVLGELVGDPQTVAAVEHALRRSPAGLRVPVSATVRAAEALRQGRTVYDDDFLGAMIRFAEGIGAGRPSDEDARRATAAAKGVVCPLQVRGSMFGVLVASSASLDPQDAAALGLFATQLSSTLQTALTIQELGERNEELARIQSEKARLLDELTRTQAELLRRERLAALGELSALVAHEVRNPLGVIFNSLGSLQRLLDVGGDAAMLLGIIGEEADRLNRIVGELLDFARPREPELRAESAPELLDGALAAVQLPAGIAVRREAAPDLPPVLADAHMIRQALVNLVQNAVQAMPRGGTLEVSAAIEEGSMRFTVADSGPGISPEFADRIFEPFFTTKASGTGLGLAVVRRIAEAHRGEVAAGPRPGGGASFTLRLPLEGAR